MNHEAFLYQSGVSYPQERKCLTQNDELYETRGQGKLPTPRTKVQGSQHRNRTIKELQYPTNPRDKFITNKNGFGTKQ